MRTVMRDLLALTTLTLLGTLALTGCASESAPRASESTAPTDAPVFASDAEALAAATEAYAAYLAMSDQILAEGGEKPERIRAFATEALAEIEIDGYDNVRSKQLRSVGESDFSGMIVQDRKSSSDIRRGIVTTYLCSDVSGVDVVDANGDSVVSVTRPNFTPFIVSFDLVSLAPVKLLVASADVWDGSGVCR